MAGNSVVFLLYDDHIDHIGDPIYLYVYIMFPTCQVIEFIKVACLLPSSSSSSSSFPPASSILLPANRELQISVGTAGPQLRAPHVSGHCRALNRRALDRSGHRRTGPQLQAPDLSGRCRASTASCRSQWALPDLNCVSQLQAPDLMPGLNSELQISVGTAGPQLRAADLSGHCQNTSTTSSKSQRVALTSTTSAGRCRTSARSHWVGDAH